MTLPGMNSLVAKLDCSSLVVFGRCDGTWKSQGQKKIYLIFLDVNGRVFMGLQFSSTLLSSPCLWIIEQYLCWYRCHAITNPNNTNEGGRSWKGMTSQLLFHSLWKGCRFLLQKHVAAIYTLVLSISLSLITETALAGCSTLRGCLFAIH